MNNLVGFPNSPVPPPIGLMSTTLDRSQETIATIVEPEPIDTSEPVKTTFNLQEIHQLLPHRYPFAFVDKIIDFVPVKKRSV